MKRVSIVYGVGGYDPTKPNNNIIEQSTVEVPDPRPAAAHLDTAGRPMGVVELYCADSNHITFRIVGDPRPQVYVCCPDAPEQWTVCASHDVPEPAGGETPEQLQQLALAAIGAISDLVAGMQQNGCPTHSVPAPVPTTVDNTIAAVLTPEFIASVLAQVQSSGEAAA